MTGLGKSVVSAIEEKYKMDDTDTDIQIFGLPKKSTDEPDEIIVPKHLCLQDTGVTHAGDAVALAKLCKNVTELDLEMNALSDWNKVFEILEQIPHCSFLNLRANPLENFKEEGKENLPKFSNIIKLVLNHTPVSWDTIGSVLQVFPNLQELFISLNKYGTVDALPELIFTPLKSLHFRSNCISDWLEIVKLGRLFPNLTNLVLLDNPLETFPCAEEMTDAFKNLKSINISETIISDWTELEKFRYFPALCELRVQDIPLLKGYKEEVRRQLLLGYLPNVTRLNGGSVKEGEKEDAERAFIRYYMDMAEEERPPRYTELESKHGKLEPLVEIDLSAKEDISIMVHFGDSSRLLQINIRQEAWELRKRIAKVFNDPLTGYALMHKRHGWPAAKEIREPWRTLLNLRFEEGDEIFVKEREHNVRWTSSVPKEG